MENPNAVGHTGIKTEMNRLSTCQTYKNNIKKDYESIPMQTNSLSDPHVNGKCQHHRAMV